MAKLTLFLLKYFLFWGGNTKILFLCKIQKYNVFKAKVILLSLSLPSEILCLLSKFPDTLLLS